MSIHAERMLVIDKDESCRQYLSSGLLRIGYYVVSVSSIKEALVSIANGRPDIIFGDLTADEISLLSTLRDPDFPPSPVIAFSHTEDASDVVTALRAGASDFIIKPFNDFSVVQEIIKRISEKIRLVKLNQRYSIELEDANRELKAGISELKADQKAGLKIQMKMLPEREKKLKGLNCDYMIKPSLYLSGDFLDFFKIDSQRSIFYIADVSGHGASSAFVTVLLKNLSNRLLRNFKRGSTDEILYPDRMLHRINRELLETEFGKHLTMFVGIHDNTTNTLTYSVGAHFPMPILVTDGHAEYLEGTGMPIGLFEAPTFRVYDRVLPKKFDLWLFTDGILEVLDAKNLAEKEQMLLKLAERSVISTDNGTDNDASSDSDVNAGVGNVNGNSSIRELVEALKLNEIHELPDDIAILTVSGVNDQDG
ncbi:PP2C family protein-serine/threonine phosphatase [Alkalimarinus alittae]|uniref:SpoIIE family protein phosphatase n=1 Tax=Alkalimarinus alittae TaxID=2961619 RepID=A0ABY6MX95_9ALTE|nr:SpoIIE family protein phosphatase [Alkalimarinus alittae]UZE94452.1 SpoIIE family protein phosphatase [Alkalimarinus alittae]